MLTQFFGSYLIDKHVITSDQLIEALHLKHITSETLDQLALSSGYMSQDEIDDIHTMQTQMDGEFIELALHMGYLTEAQAESMAQTRYSGYVLLGNSIVTLGYCSHEEMAKLIADYEFDYQLPFSDMLKFNQTKIDDMIMQYYNFPDTGELNLPKEYAALLIRNLIRFLGNDFHLNGKLQKLPYIPDMYKATQGITGSFTANTAIIAYKDFMTTFASRYAAEDLSGDDEYISASVQDFLNLHNGIFTSNMSSHHSLEADISNTEYRPATGKQLYEDAYILPIEFTFGLYYFCFRVSSEKH